MMHGITESKQKLRRTQRKTKKITCECDTYCWKKKKRVVRKKKIRRQFKFANENQNLKFLSKLRQYREILPNANLDLVSDSSEDEIEIHFPKYSKTNLPLPKFFGHREKLEDISQRELRKMIPILYKIVNGRCVHWGNQHLQPMWWPKTVPFENIKKDNRTTSAKRKTSWTKALGQIVRSCYRYYGQEYKLDGVQLDSNNNGDSIVKQSATLSALLEINETALNRASTSATTNSLELQTFIANGSLDLSNYNQEVRVTLDIFREVDENVYFAQEEDLMSEHSEMNGTESQNIDLLVNMDFTDIFSMPSEFISTLNSINSTESINNYVINDIPLSSAIQYDIPTSPQILTFIEENTEDNANSNYFLETDNFVQPLPIPFFEDYSDISLNTDDIWFTDVNMF